MFQVGQKVVKIKAPDYLGHIRNGCPKLAVGAIYTIREVDCRALGLPEHDVACVRLEGIYGPIMPETTVGRWECGYRADCFRPVVERKTSIAVFEKILADASKKRASQTTA